MEASRRTMAVALGIILLGGIGIFVNWYANTIHRLSKATDRAANKRAGRIKNLAALKNPGFNGFTIKGQTGVAPDIKIVKVPAVAAQPLPTTRPGMEIVPQNTQPTMGFGQQSTQPVVGFSQPTTQPMIGMGQPTVQPTMTTGLSVPGTPTAGLMGQANPQLIPPPIPTPAAPEPPPVKLPDPVAEKKANSKLYMAKKLEKAGKVRLATNLYREILEEYPDTEAAKTAKPHAEDIVDHRVDKARQELSHAEQFARTGSLEEAKAEYQGLISRYPETEEAKEAQRRLDAMKK
jgi:hypothetical protein